VGDFIARAKAAGLPVDFVSTHFYPSDPQCTPLVDNDCFAKTVLGARAEAAKANLPFYLTEFNDGLEFGTFRDHSYAAAFLLHNIPLMRSLDMMSWWTFTDIFEEGGLSARPFSNQFGLQTIYGVAKPVYRAFQMLHEAGNLLLNTTVAAAADGSASFVRAFAVSSALPSAPNQPALAKLDVFVTNFQRINDTLPNPTPAAGGGDLVQLTLVLRDSDPLPTAALLTLLDSTHSNPRALWEQWGAPMYPTKDQIDAMHERSKLDPQPVAFVLNTDADTGSRTVTLSFVLERNAAASIRVRAGDLQKSDTLVWAAVGVCSVVLLISALYCWRKNAGASASASKYAELDGFPRATYEAVKSVNK
jgi:xylan 1,4-beta-xylosidase